MKRMMLGFFLILLCFGGAVAAGVRIHPERIRLKREAPGAGLYKITFHSGQVMFAELMEERARDMTVRAGGSTFELDKADLSEFRPVTAEDAGDPSFKDWDFSSPAKSWISYSKEDNLFLKMFRGASSLKKSPEDIISTAMDKAGEMASSKGKANPSKMALYESIVRKNIGKKTEI